MGSRGGGWGQCHQPSHPAHFRGSIVVLNSFGSGSRLPGFISHICHCRLGDLESCQIPRSRARVGDSCARDLLRLGSQEESVRD